MEPGNYVEDNDDVERRKPPVAQPHEEYLWSMNDDGDDFDLNFDFLDDNQGPTNDTSRMFNDAPQSGAQVAEPEGNHWGPSSYGPPLNDPYMGGPYYNMPSYEQGSLSSAAFPLPPHANPPDIFGDANRFDGGQTTANATFNLHDLDSVPDLSSLKSHLEPRTFGDQNVYSDTHHAFHASYPLPSVGTMGEQRRDPGLDQSMTLPTWTTISSPANAPKSLRRRRRASTESLQAVEHPRVKRQCASCDKSFGTSKDPERLRCSRCYEKFVKHNAGHTIYTFDPNFTLGDARQHLYPPFASLRLSGDDVSVEVGNEQGYLHRLVDAITTPYESDSSNSKEDRQRVAQQTKLNKKPFDSKQYTNVLINARVRFLYQTAVSYHAGGESMYDIGGDNAGYGEDRTLKFSDRLERIIQSLTVNKDIAMDVIEGRGVTALVQNPNKYERRKRDNKKSNDTKQDLQEKGKQLHALEAGAGSSTTPFSADPGPASKRRAVSRASAGPHQQHQPSGTLADLALPTIESPLQYDGKGKGRQPDVPDGYEPVEWR